MMCCEIAEQNAVPLREWIERKLAFNPNASTQTLLKKQEGCWVKSNMMYEQDGGKVFRKIHAKDACM